MENTTPIEHPVLIVIRGIPGSGKSFLAEALEARLARDYGPDHLVILDPDKVDTTSTEYAQHVRDQTAQGVDPKLHLYRFSRARAFKAIEERRLIIWNQAFTNLETFGKMIERLSGYATDHGTELSLLIVEVETSHSTAKDRIAERSAQTGRDVPPDAFERFVSSYESWTDHFSVIKVSGEDDVAKSLRAVSSALANL